MFQDVKNIELIKNWLAKKGLSTSFKEKYFFRRLHIRMRKRKCDSYEEYYYLLNRDEREFDLLKKNLSINVTRFYRNYGTFDLFKDIFSQYVKEIVNRKKKKTIRIWSAGCAVGAEPYTIAMIVDRVLKHVSFKYDVKIMATDFNEDLLSFARRGIYDKILFDEIPENMITNYFEKYGDSQYRLISRIRSKVDFSYLDLMSESFPFRRLDMIFCRNVIIYFSRQEQERLFRKFNSALLTGGVLVLGRTETLNLGLNKIYQSLSLKHRFYQKLAYDSSLEEKSTSQETQYKCKKCGEKFYGLFDLRIHERGHKGRENIIQCKICSKILKNEIRLKVHMKFAHQIDIDISKDHTVNKTLKHRNRRKIASSQRI